jgi:glycosyltransferase involved in cell wall biosynthesis
MIPRLSVITACYNHGHFLAECMASVQAQTASDIEHVVVIDGATDDSATVAHAFAHGDPRVRVIARSENRGLAASQNEGIAIARSPWVLKVDADDAIGSTYVAELLEAAAADPGRNILFSPCFNGSIKTVYRYPPFDPARMIDVFMIPGPSAFRVDLWDSVGGYDETMRSAEDWDLYIRAQLAVGLVPHQLAEPRWFYRMHAGPRASREGMARLPELKRYWRGHTRETAIAGSRSWGAWCAESAA